MLQNMWRQTRRGRGQFHPCDPQGWPGQEAATAYAENRSRVFARHPIMVSGVRQLSGRPLAVPLPSMSQLGRSWRQCAPASGWKQLFDVLRRRNYPAPSSSVEHTARGFMALARRGGGGRCTATEISEPRTKQKRCEQESAAGAAAAGHASRRSSTREQIRY
jgi:hypothetical protein